MIVNVKIPILFYDNMNVKTIKTTNVTLILSQTSFLIVLEI